MIIKIHPHSGWYFSFGHSPNTTGYAQVRFLLACQPRNHYLLLVNEFQPKPSSERKGDRLRWKEPACILTFYVLWIEYFVEKSKNIIDTLNISFLTARTLPQSPSVTAPSRKEPLACSYSLFDFCLSAKPLLNPATMAGFSSYNKYPPVKRVVFQFRAWP